MLRATNISRLGCGPGHTQTSISYGGGCTPRCIRADILSISSDVRRAMLREEITTIIMVFSVCPGIELPPELLVDWNKS